MLTRLRQWLVPDRPKVDPDFHARMHTARAFGIAQKRESLKAQRAMRTQQANRVEVGYLPRLIQPQDGQEGPHE